MRKQTSCYTVREQKCISCGVFLHSARLSLNHLCIVRCFFLCILQGSHCITSVNFQSTNITMNAVARRLPVLMFTMHKGTILTSLSCVFQSPITCTAFNAMSVFRFFCKSPLSIQSLYQILKSNQCSLSQAFRQSSWPFEPSSQMNSAAVVHGSNLAKNVQQFKLLLCQAFRQSPWPFEPSNECCTTTASIPIWIKFGNK